MEVEKSRSLYQNSLYTFLNEDTYSEVRDFLWDIQEKDMIWEWVNALIVGHPTDDSKIVKIWKPWKDDIINEARVHNDICIALELIQSDQLLWISKDIRIPELVVWSQWNFFIMDKVVWQNFKTKFYIYLYGEKLNALWYDESQVQKISDIWIEKLLQKHSLQMLAHPNDTFLTRNEIQLEKLYKEWWEKEFHLSTFDEVKKVLELLKDKFWIEILDRNPGNFMQDESWKIFIIDFWLTK